MEEKKVTKKIDSLAQKVTFWIGSPMSLVLHTLFFITVLLLPLFGYNFETALLVLTTAVSLEAIYLALFIQMSINRNTAQLEAVEEDLEDIQEEVGDISEDVEEMQKDVEEISEDIEGIQENVEEMSEDMADLEENTGSEADREQKIENLLAELKKEILSVKK